MFYKLSWSWCLFTSKTVSQPICERWMQKDGAFKAIPRYAEGLRAVSLLRTYFKRGKKRKTKQKAVEVCGRQAGRQKHYWGKHDNLSSVLGTQSKKDSVSFMKNLSTCAVRWAMETELTRNSWARQSGVCSVAETERGTLPQQGKTKNCLPHCPLTPNAHLPYTPAPNMEKDWTISSFSLWRLEAGGHFRSLKLLLC